ncbi:GspE/PulE family protein [Fluviicoccus keumensis]|uniref:GspE/PulE family protein n=1 Tax=Fluviicoccus keumensis TaxID=1435465 RepID=UPI0013EEE5E9|nr:GspE/PulE family protein [Fluviicoccus keumensis]
MDTVRNSEQLQDYYRHPLAPQSASRLLLESGLLTKDELTKFMADPACQNSQHIGFQLQSKGLISEEDLGRLLAGTFGLPFVHIRDFDLDPSVLITIPASFARKHLLFPLLKTDNRLIVAMADPSDNTVMEKLRFMTDLMVEVAVATPADILEAISSHYGQEEIDRALENVELLMRDDPAAVDQKISDKVLERPVVQLVQNLITEAVVGRASDIHIRPRQKSVDIFFRIDGQLVRQRSFSRNLLSPIVTRLKIFGGMDISEHRIPQDGRARIRFNNKEVDLRLSLMPGIYGEDVVIRLLDSQFAMQHLEDLGYEGDDAERIRHLLSRNNGMFLVTGPTGSGKSTTLYTALEHIRNETLNIITVEDPVEYHIDGIAQIQINPQIGYTFAKALKHILRHDPDVIMLGEVRDQETAKMAVESALTGHLVLTTLHTNSAADTITRFLEIGVESYLLSSTLLGVLAQRLVRTNCPHCLVEDHPDPAIRRIMGVADDEVFHKGAGCDFCKGRGVKGRRAVYELLVMSQAIRAILVPGVQADDIQALAIREGMTPLTAHALHLARRGLISLQEAYNIRLE